MKTRRALPFVLSLSIVVLSSTIVFAEQPGFNNTNAGGQFQNSPVPQTSVQNLSEKKEFDNKELGKDLGGQFDNKELEIGRASCRERV